MTLEPIAVTPELSVADFIEDYVYRFHHRSFPVVRGARLVGIMGTKGSSSIANPGRERRSNGS